LSIAAEVDIIRRNISEGAEVSAINVNKVLSYIHINERLLDYFYEFVDRKYKRFILPEINGVDYSNKINNKRNNIIPELPKYVADIREYEINGIHVGLAALSSAASYAKCNSEISSDYGNILIRAWEVAHKSYYLGLELKSYDFDEIYIFNGRHAISRPISEILLNKSKVVYFEFDMMFRGYYLFEKPIQSLIETVERINTHTPDYEKGEDFFYRHINRDIGSFSWQMQMNQESGYMFNVDEYDKIYTYFTSSPDEFFAFSDNPYYSHDFKSQLDIALYAAENCRINNITLILRMHPHLVKKHESWRNEWDFEKLKQLGVIIIYPDDKVDSYKVLAKSHAVITCGSQMGIEAAYQGIPAGDASPSLNSRIFCCTDISTKKSFKEFIENPVSISIAKEQAIRYASYLSTGGSRIINLSEYDSNYYYMNRPMSLIEELKIQIKYLYSTASSFLNTRNNSEKNI